MYRYKITDNKKFNECFGHNKLATINEKNIDLDYIDQTFLIHYTKTNNLNLPKNTIKNVKDAIIVVLLKKNSLMKLLLL